MKIAIIAITSGGRNLAEELVKKLDNSTLLHGDEKVATTIKSHWHLFDGFIFIMAAGIVVRAISPLLQDKTHDPCVVVMDQNGHHAISLLSGHIGGGNELARHIAQLTNGTAVITTASDTLNLVALDLWMEKQHLVAENRTQLTAVSAHLINRGYLKIFSDIEVKSLPAGLQKTNNPENADIVVSNRTSSNHFATVFRPLNIVVGTGCNRGTPAKEFEEALAEMLADLHLSRLSIRNLASIDKKNDEVGLLAFAAANNWSIEYFNNSTINTLNNLEISFAALKAVGAIGVAEPSALLSARSDLLLSRKRKWKNITMAVAQVPFSLSAQVRDQPSI